MCINRNDFLQMCQKISVLPDRVCGIKKNVPKELTVIYNGIRYYPIGLTITFNHLGEQKYTAILHDMNANSKININLEKARCYDDKNM